jgi:hypothetical protein
MQLVKANQRIHGVVDFMENAMPVNHRMRNHKKGRKPRPFVFDNLVGCYNQYTNINNPNHTTSTKCQYQATASKPK